MRNDEILVQLKVKIHVLLSKVPQQILILFGKQMPWFGLKRAPFLLKKSLLACLAMQLVTKNTLSTGQHFGNTVFIFTFSLCKVMVANLSFSYWIISHASHAAAARPLYVHHIFHYSFHLPDLCFNIVPILSSLSF